MTTQIKTGDKTATVLCSASEVEAYLHNHPEFFVDHADLLAQLEVPHPSGDAVSLIERQVALIRQENKQHRERIRELVEIARDNENIVDKLQQLSIKLIAARNVDAFVNTLDRQLREKFSANNVRIVLFKESFKLPEVRLEFVSRRDSGVEHFEKFLAHRQSLCGRFNSNQLNFLFANNADDVKSMALIPLFNGETSDHSPIGMLAISSNNPDHFKVGMGTSFLTSLSGISSAILKHYVK